MVTCFLANYTVHSRQGTKASQRKLNECGFWKQIIVDPRLENIYIVIITEAYARVSPIQKTCTWEETNGKLKGTSFILSCIRCMLGLSCNVVTNGTNVWNRRNNVKTSERKEWAQKLHVWMKINHIISMGISGITN